MEVFEATNPEIVKGAEVVISKWRAISEGEVSSLEPEKVRAAQKQGLLSWVEAGLKVGSKGVVETVWPTRYADVMFQPNKIIKKPFSFAVPTVCLSVIK